MQSRGHVRIYSEVGEGTTIKLYLPRVHGPGEMEEAPGEDAVVGSPGHETILVVEDDADVRTYSCETLRDLGYQVIEADNGRAGLQALDRHPGICVLFTDVGLCGDGLRPELQALFDRLAIDPHSELFVRPDGMTQSGPDPKSEAPAPIQIVPKRVA
jgi:hypothetical protein